MTKLRVLYKDEDLLVVDKPSGRVVEGGADSLEAEIQSHYDERARALHRLDKGTSGVLAFGLRRQHHAAFVELWEKRRVKKTYLAWVEGAWPRTLAKLGGRDEQGREMETTAKLLETRGAYSLVELVPRTGRRHQLRLQCSRAGHPIAGDTRYGGRAVPALGENFALHARALAFRHPLTKQDLRLEAPAPACWATGF